MRNVLVVVDTRDLRHCVNIINKEKHLNYGEYINACINPDEEIIYSKLAYGTCAKQEAMRSFNSLLKLLGFNVVFKEPIEYKASDGSIKQRWISTNVNLAMDVVEIVNSSNKIDKVVLGCAQPELIPLVEWLKKRGIQVTLFASAVPRALREAANKVQDLTDEKYAHLITDNNSKRE